MGSDLLATEFFEDLDVVRKETLVTVLQCWEFHTDEVVGFFQVICYHLLRVSS